MANGQPNLDDLQAFPILTSDVDHVAVQRPTTTGSSSIGHLAESALRDVLSIRPTVTNPKSFVAALNNAFTATEVDGRTVWTWVPRSFTVQADMGEVTGAQASIHARAKTAIDQSVLLLEGLDSLRADADTEDVDATRAIVRSNLLELVDELGMVGGPRVQRVDALFEALLGPNEQLTDPEKVGGLFGSIRERFGLTRPRVNTIDEEQNLTNFLILVDHIIALRLSWNAQRHFFDRRGKDVFLGTQLVLLGRALEVIADSVHEAEFVMDSVLLGPAERQTLDLDFKKKLGKEEETTLKIAELLGWLERFASQEGPHIIREAGKDGVIALVPTLRELDKLVGFARDISRLPSDNPTRGFHTARVQRAMDELSQHVNTALKLATEVQRTVPDIRFVDPQSAAKSASVALLLFGGNFQPGAQARLRLAKEGEKTIEAGKTIRAESTHFISEGALRATFNLSDQDSGTTWHVIVVNPDGARDIKRNAFTIEGDYSKAVLLPSRQPSSPVTPKVVRVSPLHASNAEADVRLTIEASDIAPDADVMLIPAQPTGEQNITPKKQDVIADHGLIIADFDLRGHKPGEWVVVVRQHGNEVQGPQPFLITEPQSVSPPDSSDVTGTPFQVQHIQFLDGERVVDKQDFPEEPLRIATDQAINTIRITFNKAVDTSDSGFFLRHEERGQTTRGELASPRIIIFAAEGEPFPDGSYSVIGPDERVIFWFAIDYPEESDGRTAAA